MTTKHLETECLTRAPAAQVVEWECLVLSACRMLEQMPPTAMTSISMTGSLSGVDGDARSLAVLCRRIADEHGFRQTMQIGGTSFTVRFSRRDGRRPVLRRKLGSSI